MIMIKDHGIEDHLLRQVKILMELDVLQKILQNIDERTTGKPSDRRNAEFSHSKVESARLNGNKYEKIK